MIAGVHNNITLAGVDNENSDKNINIYEMNMIEIQVLCIITPTKHLWILLMIIPNPISQKLISLKTNYKNKVNETENTKQTKFKENKGKSTNPVGQNKSSNEYDKQEDKVKELNILYFSADADYMTNLLLGADFLKFLKMIMSNVRTQKRKSTSKSMKKQDQ
jgi:hypothetical protein